MLSQSAHGINKISWLKGRLTKRAHLLAITTQGRPSRSTCRPSPPDWVPLDHLILHLRRDITLPENRHYSSSQLPVTIVLGPRWCEGWSRDSRRHMKSEHQVVSRGWQPAWVLQSVADPCDCQPVYTALACASVIAYYRAECTLLQPITHLLVPNYTCPTVWSLSASFGNLSSTTHASYAKPFWCQICSVLRESVWCELWVYKAIVWCECAKPIVVSVHGAQCVIAIACGALVTRWQAPSWHLSCNHIQTLWICLNLYIQALWICLNIYGHFGYVWTYTEAFEFANISFHQKKFENRLKINCKRPEGYIGMKYQ